jgi:hypothetical protein
LSPIGGSPDSCIAIPLGGGVGPEARAGGLGQRGGAMKLIKRIAVAIGSLAALALAGGAHLRF